MERFGDYRAIISNIAQHLYQAKRVNHSCCERQFTLIIVLLIDWNTEPGVVCVYINYPVGGHDPAHFRRRAAATVPVEHIDDNTDGRMNFDGKLQHFRQTIDERVKMLLTHMQWPKEL